MIVPQLAVARIAPRLSTQMLCVAAYVVGATLVQALFLAIHELSHNLFFKSTLANRLFAIFANVPLIVPFAIAFRNYHLEHHKMQGVDGMDLDIPTTTEGRYVRGVVRKALWLSFQLFAYALRPLLLRPQPFTFGHFLNAIVQTAFNLFVVRMWGGSALAYLALSVFFAGGLHPCAGHFLAEHYTFVASPASK